MDDLLVTRRNIVFVEEFKQDMIKVFEMTDCREIAFFFSEWKLNRMKMEFYQPKEICKRYFEEVLDGEL